MHMFRNVIALIGLTLALALPAQAQQKVQALATFSILADLTRQVGGDRVAVSELIGPDGDSHVFQPAPADARKVSDAKVIITNGLGLEGWLERLVRSSGSKATQIVATRGIKAMKGDRHGHGHSHGHAHDVDPHAWQSVANVKIYVANIRDGLIAADPDGRTVYEANASAYLEKLDALDRDVRAAIAAIPEERRKVITSHDAFAYFGAAYGLTFVAPTGVSTEAAASARDVARIIRQIKREKIPAVFLENISDDRLIQQIARETGAKIGGKIYSDALSPASGPAATYIDMIRHNVAAFTQALR